jgi:hypothetical protein
VKDGAHGVHFIQQAVESHRLGTWVDAAYTPPGAELGADPGPGSDTGESS